MPALIAECEERWQIRIGPRFELSFNYVAPAVDADGREIVLKLGPELSSEISALEAYGGKAAVGLLDFDKDRGILLLERLAPGDTLASIADDEQATRIAARTMRELWRPLPAGARFATVGEWADGLSRLRPEFDGGTGPFPVRLVEMAESLFRDLLASSAAPVLLHGDLHYSNILAARRRPWVAIDPKGVTGERAYEVGAILRNPNGPRCADYKVQRRRLAVLEEELGFDQQRMAGWGIAQAVLSAWWSYEDGAREWKSMCACAEAMAPLVL